jgi:hypothetical protein
MPSNSTDPDAPAAGRGSLLANVALAVASTTVVFLLLEGALSLLMAAREATHTPYMREESHSRYDADLGWSHRPGLRIEGMYGEGTAFTTNSQGFRAREEFAKAVPKDRYRVIALGDSFTMGYGVDDDASYAARMHAFCPTLQTVNMGQGGYGVDQDYLWYKRDGAKLDAQLLLFAFVAEDFFRMAGDTFTGYPKPVLRALGGKLAVGNVPVPRAWESRTTLRRLRNFVESLALVRTGRWIMEKVEGKAEKPKADEFYGNVGDEVFAAAGLAFDDLAAVSKARGQHLVLVYLPVIYLLPREPSREAAWLERYSRESGVPFINLTAEFEKLTPAEIARMYRPDYHYTDEGNRFVARALLRHLGARVPGFPACAGAPPT